MIPENFENIREDGKLQKSILKAAEGDDHSTPANGQMAEILYVCRKSDYSVVDENNKVDDPFEFEVGGPDVIRGLNEGVVTMKKGERAVFKIDAELAYGPGGSGNIAPNETIYFEAELIDFFDKKKTKLDFKPHERLEIGRQLKEEGSAFFAKGDLEGAAKKFDEALDYIDWETLPEVLPLKVAMRNNLALIDLKTNRLGDAIKNCNLAIELDPKNVKSYFRKGKAQRLLQEFEAAEKTLSKALEIDLENSELLAEIAQLRKDKADFAAKEKNLYSNMFSKGNLY